MAPLYLYVSTICQFPNIRYKRYFNFAYIYKTEFYLVECDGGDGTRVPGTLRTLQCDAPQPPQAQKHTGVRLGGWRPRPGLCNCRPASEREREEGRHTSRLPSVKYHHRVEHTYHHHYHHHHHQYHHHHHHHHHQQH